MTRDDIMRWSGEARLPACHATHQKALLRFAKLVAAAERDACAKICDQLHQANLTAHKLNSEVIPAFPFDPDDCAAAIRARGDE